MKRTLSFAVITVALSYGIASAQQATTPADAARQEAVIHAAMSDYQNGIEKLVKDSIAAQPDNGALRELRLEEAVNLALEKNLDIQVAKLEPQSNDFLIAGVRNQFQPILASTVGQRDLFQLPTRTISGGTRVSQATTTYNASIAQEVPLFGGNYTVAWSNQRVASSDALSTRNPLYTTGLTAS